MDDIKDNSFYKACQKENGKSMAIAIAGIAVLAAGVLFIIAVRGLWVLKIALVGFGLLMLIRGYEAVKGMKAVKEDLDFLSPAERAQLDINAAQCRFGTFYLTQKYILIPAAFTFFEYSAVQDITAVSYGYRGRQNGLMANFELFGREPVSVAVKEWGSFQANMGDFRQEILARSQA